MRAHSSEKLFQRIVNGVGRSCLIPAGGYGELAGITIRDVNAGGLFDPRSILNHHRLLFGRQECVESGRFGQKSHRQPALTSMSANAWSERGQACSATFAETCA